jgi:hypothetical protein
LFRDIQKPVEKGAIAKKLTELLRKKEIMKQVTGNTAVENK